MKGEYEFEYNADYIAAYPDQLITFSLPVRREKYVANRLFPFFEGLIPEGWLLDFATKNWKLNANDRMGLVLACWVGTIYSSHLPYITRLCLKMNM